MVFLFYSENSRDFENNVFDKTKKRLIDDFQNITLISGDRCLISFFKNFSNIYVCKAVKNDENNYESHNSNIVVKTLECTG